MRQRIDHRGCPYIQQFCRCVSWSWRLRHPGRQIVRRGCYADAGRDDVSHRWRVQRALTGWSVVAVHVVQVSCCKAFGFFLVGGRV